MEWKIERGLGTLCSPTCHARPLPVLRPHTPEQHICDSSYTDMLLPPKSIVYTKVHSLCCILYRFGQMCNDVHLLGWAWGLPARATISGESSGNKGSISQADIGALCDHLAVPTSLTSCHHALYYCGLHFPEEVQTAQASHPGSHSN